MVFLVVLLYLLELHFAVDYSNKANGGLKNVMYYGDWSVWEGDDMFYPSDLPADQITHLNFAFVDLDSNGNLVLTDVDADYGHDFDNPNIEWGSANAGLFPAFQDLRGKYPNLRIGVSIGGWSKSGDFSAVAKDATKRANFVNSVAKFVEYNNLDFIDIDWEYPGEVRAADTVDNKNDEGTPQATPQDGLYFIQLLEDLKAKENELSLKNNRIYELSVALPAAIGKIQLGAQAYLPPGVTLDTATADQIQEASTNYVTLMFKTIDYGNLMTYDLRGEWDPTSGHHANLYAHPSANPDNEVVDFSADATVSYFLGKTTDSQGNPLKASIVQGVPPEKLVVGAAFYTRGWEKVDNNGDDAVRYPGLYGTVNAVNADADGAKTSGAHNFLATVYGDGGRNSGSWPYGTITQLKKNYTGLTYYYDEIAQAPYLYSATTGAFFSYDSPKSIAAKADYVKKYGLGGIISWMASNDGATGDEENGVYAHGQVRGVLTKAIKAGLWGATTPLEQFSVGLYVNVSATVAVNGTTGYSITVKNNFANSETNAALRYAAGTAGPISNPVLYITVKDGVTITPAAGITQTGNVVQDVLSGGSLGAGRNVTTRLTTTATGVNVSDIVKIELGKSIYEDGKEVGRAIIYTAQ